MFTSLKFIAHLVLIGTLLLACPLDLPLNLKAIASDRFEVIKGKETECVVKVAIDDAPSKAHEAAVRKCAAIFADMWKSDADISIAVQFESISNETLGRCTPGSFVSLDELWVPSAFAKKVSTSKVLSWNPIDMYISMNPNVKWFLDVEGECPKDSYDFMGTFLHELYHGTLFIDFQIKVSGENASFQASKGRYFPFLAVSTAGGDCSIWSYFKHPKLLKAALTSNNLWFVTSQGRLDRIYAPKEFLHGKSIFHRHPEKKKKFLAPFIIPGVKNRERDETFLRIEQAMLNLSEPGAPFCDASLPQFAPIERVDRDDETSIPLTPVLIAFGVITAVLGICIAVLWIRKYRRRRAGTEPSDAEPYNAEPSNAEPSNATTEQ